ncbi:MAG: hypothetical protein ACR2RB_21755, partial [Gammaproteobacteria bacterium]
GVIGRKGRFFFRVAGDRQSPSVTAKASRLVGAFAALDDSGSPDADAARVPEGLALLRDRLGIAEADIQYQESNVFQYDFASRFWFADAGSGDDARVFVHVADSPDAAGNLFAALLEEQSYDYEQLTSEGSRAVFRHEFLNTYFVLAHHGRYVYGAEQLADSTSADALLGRLSGSLERD